MNKANRILFVFQLRQSLPGMISGFVLVLFCLGFIWYTVYDTLDKPVRHQVGIVKSNTVVPPISSYNPVSVNLAGIQVGNKTAYVDTAAALPIGQKLNVDYTIGRSGTLTVDHYVPIAGTK